LRSDVKILEKDRGIKGKSLQKLLLRNVDWKGDCLSNLYTYSRFSLILFISYNY
jgi:hypothetical protein